MSRADDRAIERKRAAALLARKQRQAQRDELEARAVETFVPTPRATRLAAAVQRVLGPTVDDPVYGRRANMVAQLKEALDSGQNPNPDGKTPNRNA